MPTEATQLISELVLNVFLLIVITLGLLYGYRFYRRRSAENARSQTRQAILDDNQDEQENVDQTNDL